MKINIIWRIGAMKMESNYYFVLCNFIYYVRKAQADLQGQFVLFSTLTLLKCRGPPIGSSFKNSS